MKSQNTIFKWIAIPIVLAVFVNSALVLPSVSAQDEFPPTPTQTPTEEPVVDDFPESTPQPPSEGESIQSFSALAVTTPSQPDPDCTDGRCVFWVGAGTDDAGVHPNCTYSTSTNEIYMGQCSNGQPITSGFRFPNVNIPAGTIIQKAYIEFTVDGPYTDDLNVAFYGQASGNAATFSNISRPSNRSLTTASAPWHIPSTEPWSLNQIKDTPSLTTIVQEIVNHPDWVSGNAMAIILKNVGPSSGTFKHRRVIAYNRPPFSYGSANAARLVIEIGGCTTDTFEPDNSSSTGTTFILGENPQRHSLCPQNDEDWVNFRVSTTRSVNGNLLVETFDLEPDSITPNGNTQLTVLDESSLNQIGTNQDRGFGPFPGSIDVVKSSRVVWHPAIGGVFNIKVVPETPISEQAGSGYSLRLTNPLTLVDPVDQASWGPTTVNVPFVTRNGNTIYFTQFFTYEQAELDALNNVPATLAWEFRRPAVDTNTGEEKEESVDYGDYWQNVNGACVGEYWTNLPNHSDKFVEESNSVAGCIPNDPNNPLAPDNEEFELYVDDTTQLVAGQVYYITIKFHIHPQYLNSDYQFYISKAEYCQLLNGMDFICNLGSDKVIKHTANLIEGYLQPAP